MDITLNCSIKYQQQQNNCFFSGRTTKRGGVNPLEQLRKQTLIPKTKNCRLEKNEEYKPLKSRGWGALDDQPLKNTYFLYLP